MACRGNSAAAGRTKRQSLPNHILPDTRPANITLTDYAARIAVVRAQMEDALHELDCLNLQTCGCHLSMAIDYLPDIRIRIPKRPSKSAFSDSIAKDDSDKR
jgi:hypothetical protein